MILNKILSFLILLGGALISGVLHFSLGWSEHFDEQYKTPFHIAVAVLIPLTLLVSIRLWRKPN